MTSSKAKLRKKMTLQGLLSHSGKPNDKTPGTWVKYNPRTDQFITQASPLVSAAPPPLMSEAKAEPAAKVPETVSIIEPISETPPAESHQVMLVEGYWGLLKIFRWIWIQRVPPPLRKRNVVGRRRNQRKRKSVVRKAATRTRNLRVV